MVDDFRSPDESGHLELGGADLGRLSPEIWRQAGIRSLSLSQTDLSRIPAGVFELTELTTLRLSNNPLLVDVPDDIAGLTNLRSLYLNETGLTAFPRGIGRLPNLQLLDISGNPGVTPDVDLSALTGLRRLDLDRNKLPSLPAAMRDLTGLDELWLDHNPLGRFPDVLLELPSLEILHLENAGLSEIPAGISNLRRLNNLDLMRNALTTLPDTMAELSQLRTLQLSGNHLAAVPDCIPRLASLATLRLNRNQLTDLPAALGAMPHLVSVDLEGNPLRDPLPDVVSQGPERLKAYLRSLTAATAQYETKVLLVGEGAVGKSSLAAALLGEPFVENRPTTHGIELARLSLPHPDGNAEIDLNIWDFGGQEVYRITHQFFFSRRALYVLVWNPRQGQEQNEVEGWLRRIRLRVGRDVRVLLVATHAQERRAEIDYPSLRQQFPEILAPRPYAVDSRTGEGLDELRAALAAEAAGLPQMGELISTRWVDCRRDIEQVSHPYISRQAYRDICEAHGLEEIESETLAQLLHDLGHVVHYGEDEGLRDTVVLQPEWLTKAISYVLEDEVTRAHAGVLEHRRLREIWGGAGGTGPVYPREFHPFFVRLMEKFDVSYRLDDEEASQVAQLVPAERPRLPWDDAPEPDPQLRTLSFVCRMSEEPPGVLAWLTVRNHRFAVQPTGLHWRRGTFLVHRAQEAEALFEMLDSRSLRLTVRAPSPDYFFALLRDSIEYLVERRWPGLDFTFLIPCPDTLPEGGRCTHQFKLTTLTRYRELRRATIECPECIKDQSVDQLVTGFLPPAAPLANVLDELGRRANEITREVRDSTDRVLAEVREVKVIAAEGANQIRMTLTAISAEVTDCPRLFTIAERRAGFRESFRIGHDHLLLTLWCEHPGHEHPWREGSYEISRPKGWLSEVEPYVRLIVRVLKVSVPVAGAIAGAVMSETDFTGVQGEVDLMKALVDKLPETTKTVATAAGDADGADGAQGLTPAEGAALRAFRIFLFEIDQARAFGGLRRRITASGDLAWICADHYREYDPGIPTLPAG